MNVTEMFPGRWITSKTLQGREFDLTIRDLTQEKIGGDKRWVLWFRECEAGLPLNKTNAATIADLHGSETERWVGRRITLFPGQATWQGKTVPAVRVKLSATEPMRGTREPPPKVEESEVPF